MHERMKRWLPAGAVLAALVAVCFMIRAGVLAPDLARERALTPAGMVHVAAGDFLMGSDDADADAEVKPRRPVFVPSFYIDRTEVTHAEYANVYPVHTYPPGRENLPVTRITRDQASAYLERIGKRLPTAAEWEKAARGTDGRRFPWGDAEPEQRHLKRGKPAPALPGGPVVCPLPRAEAVGSYPAGASPYGCLDMAGNAWEWIADDYSSSPPRQIIRGGAPGYREEFLRTYAFSLEDSGIT